MPSAIIFWSASLARMVSWPLFFRIHPPLPIAVFGVKDESGVKYAVLFLEEEMNLVAIPLGVSNDGIVHASLGIEPDANIFGRVLVPADKNHRLLGGQALAVLFA